jgi:TonB family protein
MNDLLLYLAQAGGCLLACYGFYHLVLRKETCFQYNRAYLLLTPALSFLLPLVPLPDWLLAWPFASEDSAGTVLVEASYSGQVLVAQAEMPAVEPFDWEPVIWTLYGLGFCFFAYRFLRQLFTIRQYIRQYQPEILYRDGIKLLLTRGQLPTFSFFSYLFWDNSQAATEDEKQKILQHESVHIAQKHTWDILYLELITLVFWFHPVLYLYKKALAQTHEFIADAEVIRTTDHREYATLLVQQAFKQMNLSLGHCFNKSLTLKRMKMLQRNHLRPNRLKQMLAFPFMAALLLLVSAENSSVAGDMENPDPAAEMPENKLPGSPDAALPGSGQNPSQGQAAIAVFPGGKPALKKYLAKNLRYPAEALKNGITGQAIILVTIDEQGRPGDFKTLQADNPYLAEEAIRVLKDMPAWQPASAKEAAQAYTLAFPFIFGLESNKGLPALQVPAIKTKYVLQDVTTVVGYSKVIPGKTMIQKSVTPVQQPKSTTAYPRDNKVFSFVEQQPQFPGGLPEMNNFIRENLRYPAEAKKSGTEGLVVVQFVVDRNGKISDPAVVKSLTAATDAEAVRLVKSFPDFEPAQQNGKPVEFRFTLPIRFGLAPKDPANGYIPPSQANPAGSYLSTGTKEPAAADCIPELTVSMNVVKNNDRASQDLILEYVKPAGCPAGDTYQIESTHYYIARGNTRLEKNKVTGQTIDLTGLMSRALPGDVLNIYAMGKTVTADGKPGKPFLVGKTIPLKK